MTDQKIKRRMVFKREDYRFVLYISNILVSKYIKQKLMELKIIINSNTITVGDFNNPLSTINRSSK